jgi:hypothetical protein
MGMYVDSIKGAVSTVEYEQLGLIKNDVFWDVTGLALVRADVSKEPSASIIRVTRIAVLG